MFLLFLFPGCSKNSQLVVVKYSPAGEDGLYVYSFDKKEGILKELSKSEAGPNPSFFCFFEKRNMIYTVNEVTRFNDTQNGGLTTLKYNNKNHKYQKINDINIPKGGPCHISIAPGEDFLLIASYSSGSVAVVRLDKNGVPESITDTIIYEGPKGKISHPHMISFDPVGKRVYLTDLGLDRIMIYNLDKISGRLQQAKKAAVYLPEGSGPRHFVFNADGSKMYVIDELNSTILVFNVDENEGLILSQSINTVADGFKDKNYCADIHIGKNGDFLYGSNRGENTIVIFRIGKDGSLNLAGRTSCGGDWPRNFTIDPSGMYILVGNQRSDNLSVLRINQKTGIPTLTGQQVKITTPACLRFMDAMK